MRLGKSVIVVADVAVPTPLQNKPMSSCQHLTETRVRVIYSALTEHCEAPEESVLFSSTHLKQATSISIRAQAFQCLFYYHSEIELAVRLVSGLLPNLMT